jgi:hypothetical protein
MGKKNVVKILFIFIVLIVVIFIVTINFKVHVSTSKIKMGTYEDKYEFKGVFIFQEYSAYHGSIDKNKMKIKPGQRVSKGSTIADGISAPEAGIVVLNYDGWENKYSLKNIKNITAKDMDNILKNPVKEQGIKIINNSEWFICALAGSELSKELKKGSVRDILLNDNYYRIEVVDNFKNSNGSFIIMKMKDDPETIDLHRGITGYIIRARYKGFIIPSDSITKYNDNEGVYIKSNNYAEIRLIKVLFKNEETAVVAPLERAISKLSEYDTVIRRPEHIKNGTKVR